MRGRGGSADQGSGLSSGSWALLLLALGCGPSKSGGADSSVEPEAPSWRATDRLDLAFDGATPRNLILLVVDTLRRDHVSLYPGADPAFTPGLEALSDHLFRVDGLHHPSNWTGPDTATLLTGREPVEHGILYGGDPGYTLPVDGLAQSLSEQGYATGQFSGNGPASSEYGLDDGFDEAWLKKDPTAATLFGVALDWLDTLPSPGGPFFLHLQPMEPHTGYAPPDDLRGLYERAPDDFPTGMEDQQALMDTWESLDAEAQAELRANLSGLYAEEVLAVDRQIAAFIEDLDAAGRLDDTLVVILNDHGEELDDAGDGEFLHGLSLRPEVTAGALLFYNPRLYPGESSALVAGYDLLPSLMALEGLSVPEGLDGLALSADAARGAVYGGRYAPSPSDGLPVLKESYATDGASRVLRTCDGQARAYDMANDPHELEPLAVSEVPDGAALQSGLETWGAEVMARQGWHWDCGEP